jgi:hypothetical protein
MAALVVVGLVTAGPAVWADTITITSADIFDTLGVEQGSGNGTLDFIFFTESQGGAENSASGFDGDDANTDMPTGNHNTTAMESFVTSIGELRDFYKLNFPDGLGGSTVDEIVLFVDINQTTSGSDISLDGLEIWIDYDATFGDDRDDPGGTDPDGTYIDVDSSLQNATNSSFSGGTLAAVLDSPKLLPLLAQHGAGFEDYAILTGINPFDDAYCATTRILFDWQSSGHNDGGETIFLSGEYSAHDVPEPGALLLLASGAWVAGMAYKRRLRISQ